MLQNFVSLLSGFQVALAPENIGACLLGAVLGLVVGAMPGIGSLAGCALLLPLTYKFNPTTAIIMLGALYYSNMYGGSFSAILLNIPGDSPAITTALDGYPMAKKGRPGQALMAANLASFIGGTIGILILTITASGLASLGLKFGYAEMTLILLIAMTSISWLIGENPIKGIVITMLGILVASIGMDTLSGAPRFEFGSMYLLGGVPFTPFIIGCVGFAQVIKLINEREADDAKRHNEDSKAKLSIRSSMPTGHDIKRILPPILRSGVMGTFVGVLPGSGATTGSMVGYAMQKKFKSEEPMGTGAIEGIAASEAANNAAAAGAFAPLLALGGNVDFVISKPAAASQYVESGDLHAVLALSTERYTGNLADAPTLSEIGDYNNVEVPVWRGVAAPASMSDAAVAFWSDALGKVSASSTWHTDYLEKNQLIDEYKDTAAATEYVTAYEADFMAANGIN